MAYEKKYGYDLPERQIMINSNFVHNQFPELIKVLQQHESLNEKVAQNLDEKVKKILEREIIVNIFEQARKEWTAVKEGYDLKVDMLEGHERVKCQLCRQPNKKKYYIINKYNDSELHVGSECIKKYEINIELQKGQTREQFFKEQAKRANKLKRERIFNEQFPDARLILRDWNTKHQNYPLMLPATLDDEYIRIYNEANKIFDGFVQGNIKLNEIKEFESLINQMSKLQNKISEYIEGNKHDKFIVNKAIEKWILNKIKREEDRRGLVSSAEIYKRLKETGKIDKDTFPYIHEENFVKKVSLKIENILKNIDIGIQGLNFEKNTFVLAYHQTKQVSIDCYFKDLFEIFCEYIFDNENTTFRSQKYRELIIEKSKIVSEDSVEQAILYLRDILKEQNIFVEWYGLKLNKVVIRYAKKGFMVAELFSFVNIHRSYLLIDKRDSIDTLVCTLKRKELKTIEKMKDEMQDLKDLENMS